jgi:hypothetical protein
MFHLVRVYMNSTARCIKSTKIYVKSIGTYSNLMSGRRSGLSRAHRRSRKLRRQMLVLVKRETEKRREMIAEGKEINLSDRDRSGKREPNDRNRG